GQGVGGGGGSGGGGTEIRDIDLSGAQTIDDIRSAIEAAGVGARVAISEDGSGLDIFNSISGRTLSVEEIPGGPQTATQLGLRTFTGNTAVASFNAGRGVRIVDNVSDVQTGTPTRALNTDLRVSLGNGQFFDVDLRPADMLTVQTVIDRINAEFAAAVGSQLNPSAPALVAGQFAASLGDGPNGIVLTETPATGGGIKVSTLNNSPAADQLGLLSLTAVGGAGSGSVVSQDRLGLRVDSVLSALVALRDALLANNVSGITVAGEDLSKARERLQVARGVVGGYGQRVADQQARLEDQDVLDSSIRSSLMDTDFAEASTRLSALSTQLEAGLRAAGIAQGRTLFDFLR
ncbi:MAG: hypothetical protein MUE97_06535, partial [Phycisphaerales bacterium]|nr:hypothetical protein [Phycisphaerales bacterium]